MPTLKLDWNLSNLEAFGTKYSVLFLEGCPHFQSIFETLQILMCPQFRGPEYYFISLP